MNLKTKFTLISIFAFTCIGLKAQNLILNPSFEEVNTCFEFNATCAPAAWWGVKPEHLTYQERGHTGKNSLRLVMEIANMDTKREYVQTPLLCPLTKWKQFVFSMYLHSKKRKFICPQVYFSQENLCIRKFPYKSVFSKGCTTNFFFNFQC